MIFQGFKESILTKKFEKELNLLESSLTSNTKKISSVGILTTEALSSNQNLQAQVERILGVKNAKIYSFRKYHKTNEVSYKHFSEKDINWKGEYTEPSFHSFLEEPFDLLIGYFDSSNLYLEMAVLQSNATFKVGFSNIREALFDITISESTLHVDAFLQELKKYLVILEKL